MRFATESHVSERLLSSLVSDFVAIVGPEVCAKRQGELQRQRDENQLLFAFIRERHSLELALFDLLRRRRSRGRLSEKTLDRDTYQAFSFMTMIIGFHRHMSGPGRDRLVGRLRDGLQSEYGLIPIQHEMGVAAHFMRRGFDVEPCDLEKGGGYDFLMTKDRVVVEVECKMASPDIGRQIHRRTMAQLSWALNSTVKRAAAQATGGHLLTVSLNGRLNKQPAFHQKIAESIAEVMQKRCTVQTEEYSVSLNTFNLSATSLYDCQGADGDKLKGFLKYQMGRSNAHAFAYCVPRKVSIVVVVESKKQDKVIKGIYEQLKDATKRQFSKERAGVLAVQLSDLHPDQVEELGRLQEKEPNGLQAIAARLFRNAERSFLHTVTFVGTGTANQHREVVGREMVGVVTGGGPAYVFKNPNNPYLDGRVSLF